jgi:hypothetical protein
MEKQSEIKILSVSNGMREILCAADKIANNSRSLMREGIVKKQR